MEASETRTSGVLRYTLRGLLVLTAAVACVLGLARWFGSRGGLAIAIPITVLPFTFIVERVFSASGVSHAPTPTGHSIWRHLGIVAGGFVVAVAAWLGTSAGVPKLISPLPFLVVLPLLFSVPWVLVMVIPIATFLILNHYLGCTGPPQSIPLRFPVLLGMATAFSIWWFAYGAPYAFAYHGPTYTIGITIINSLLVAVLWFVWYLIRQGATFWMMIAWSLGLHCWLFWFAFPWLGEMP